MVWEAGHRHHQRAWAAYRLVARIPSPINSVAKPASRNRRATSRGTSRPLVSLFGVPV
jgi:hypothetical protein